MNFYCTSRRAGLTLIELVVVMVILAAIAALVIPRVSGISSQSAFATNAAIVADVNNAVSMYETRNNGKHPVGWDSLLNSTDAYFTKLNPKLTAASPALLQIVSLDDGQAKSLQDAGITGFHDADESRVANPSDNSTVFRFLSSGKKVVTLVKTPIASGHGSTLIDNALNINQYKSNWNNEFVVCGLGGPTGLKGTAMREIPLVQSAEPNKYYSRVLCVYMIPAAGATTTFPAQYVGCFLPDGTSLRQNVDKFNTADVPVN